MLDVAQKASRARALLSDEILAEVLDGLRAEQVAVFEGRSTDEQLKEARHMVWALDAVRARLQSLCDDMKMLERRKRGGTVE